MCIFICSLSKIKKQLILAAEKSFGKINPLKEKTFPLKYISDTSQFNEILLPGANPAAQTDLGENIT